MIKLNEGHGETIIKKSEYGALLVEGIEVWIDSLLPAAGLKPHRRDGLLMQDNKTGAKFAVRRVSDA